MHRFGDRGREVLEILGFGESAIDAGEADIGDIVEAPERLQHHRADLLRLDFILARGFELALDSRYEAFDPRAVDRALAARDLDAAHQFLAIEGLARPAGLEHRDFAELDAFEGRSEERRGGKECVGTCRSGGSPYH